jgi:hypothetical protein
MHSLRGQLLLAAIRLTAEHRIDELLTYHIKPRWALARGRCPR